MSLLFHMLVCVCHSFLPRSKCQVSFNFMAAVTICIDFGAQENNICHCFHFSPSICHKVMGMDAMFLVFWMLIFKPAFPPLIGPSCMSVVSGTRGNAVLMEQRQGKKWIHRPCIEYRLLYCLYESIATDLLCVERDSWTSYFCINWYWFPKFCPCIFFVLLEKF